MKLNLKKDGRFSKIPWKGVRKKRYLILRRRYGHKLAKTFVNEYDFSLGKCWNDD